MNNDIRRITKMNRPIYTTARRLTAWAGLAVLAVSVSGCGFQPDSTRTLTTIESPAGQAPGPIQVAQINKIEGIQGVEWLSEQEIVYTQKVKSGEDQQGQPIYKTTRGIRNLQSGEIRDTKPWNMVDVRTVSPDGKHAYVINHWSEGENLRAKHSIENLETGQVQMVSAEAVAGEGLWLDSKSYMLIPGIGEGPVVQIDLNGTATSLPLLSESIQRQDGGFWSSQHFSKVGDRIYFQTFNYPEEVHNLNYFFIRDLERPVIHAVKDGVTRYRSSPDGTRIAVLKSNNASNKELLLMDPEGKGARASIAKDVSSNLDWSADSSKLAFSVMNSPNHAKQISILDISTGSITPVFEYMRTDNELAWSPSGKQLMVTTDMSNDGGVVSLPLLNIIQFK
jgi:hypothetical protein